MRLLLLSISIMLLISIITGVLQCKNNALSSAVFKHFTWSKLLAGILLLSIFTTFRTYDVLGIIFAWLNFPEINTNYKDILLIISLLGSIGIKGVIQAIFEEYKIPSSGGIADIDNPNISAMNNQQGTSKLSRIPVPFNTPYTRLSQLSVAKHTEPETEVELIVADEIAKFCESIVSLKENGLPGVHRQNIIVPIRKWGVASQISEDNIMVYTNLLVNSIGELYGKRENVHKCLLMAIEIKKTFDFDGYTKPDGRHFGKVDRGNYGQVTRVISAQLLNRNLMRIAYGQRPVDINPKMLENATLYFTGVRS